MLAAMAGKMAERCARRAEPNDCIQCRKAEKADSAQHRVSVWREGKQRAQRRRPSTLEDDKRLRHGENSARILLVIFFTSPQSTHPRPPDFAPHRMATDTTLRPGEIKDILLREIEAADLHDARRRRGRDRPRGQGRHRPHLRPPEGDGRRDARDHVVRDRREDHGARAEPRRRQHRRGHPRRLPAAQGRRRGPSHRRACSRCRSVPR